MRYYLKKVGESLYARINDNVATFVEFYKSTTFDSFAEAMNALSLCDIQTTRIMLLEGVHADGKVDDKMIDVLSQPPKELRFDLYCQLRDIADSADVMCAVANIADVTDQHPQLKGCQLDTWALVQFFQMCAKLKTYSEKEQSNMAVGVKFKNLCQKPQKPRNGR